MSLNIKKTSGNAEREQGQFVGKAWENTSKSGSKYFRITLDAKISEITLSKDNRIALVPNKKRDGKKDADFSLIIS